LPPSLHVPTGGRSTEPGKPMVLEPLPRSAGNPVPPVADTRRSDRGAGRARPPLPPSGHCGPGPTMASRGANDQHGPALPIALRCEFHTQRTLHRPRRRVFSAFFPGTRHVVLQCGNPRAHQRPGQYKDGGAKNRDGPCPPPVGPGPGQRPARHRPAAADAMPPVHPSWPAAPRAPGTAPADRSRPRSGSSRQKGGSGVDCGQ
jgi:hypothetical protein